MALSRQMLRVGARDVIDWSANNVRHTMTNDAMMGEKDAYLVAGRGCVRWLLLGAHDADEDKISLSKLIASVDDAR